MMQLRGRCNCLLRVQIWFSGFPSDHIPASYLLISKILHIAFISYTCGLLIMIIIIMNVIILVAFEFIPWRLLSFVRNTFANWTPYTQQSMYKWEPTRLGREDRRRSTDARGEIKRQFDQGKLQANLCIYGFRFAVWKIAYAQANIRISYILVWVSD